jgi:hypothetical protein
MSSVPPSWVSGGCGPNSPVLNISAIVRAPHFDRALSARTPDLIAARRILRKATVFRISDLIPPVLAQFDKLSPVIREAAAYLHAVLDKEKARTFEQQIRDAWEKKVHASTYISEWMSFLFTNPCFNEINLPAQYGDIPDIRGKALIALRRNDADWVKRQSAHLDSFDYWDRRAVLYACSLLAPEERARIIKMRHHGITERMIVRKLQKLDGQVAGPGAGGGYVADSPGLGGGYVTDSPGLGGGYATDSPGLGGGYVTDSPGLGGGYVTDSPGLGGGYKPVSAAGTQDRSAAGVKGPDNYPSYGDKVAGPSAGGGYVADGPGLGGGYKPASPARTRDGSAAGVKGPDNYPSYGDKVAGPGNTGGYGSSGSSADFGDKEVMGPDSGGGYDEGADAGGAEVESPDNYPSYGNKTSGTASSGGYGASEPDDGASQDKPPGDPVGGPGAGGGYAADSPGLGGGYKPASAVKIRDGGAPGIMAPDNYPSYGDKTAGTGSSGGYGASSPDDDAGDDGSASR